MHAASRNLTAFTNDKTKTLQETINQVEDTIRASSDACGHTSR